jgi:predicted glycosyltransferase
MPVTRIWFDTLTPKQALFCQKIGNQFEAAGFELIFTTREYSEVTGKLDQLGITAQVIGKHGGAGLYDKLRASAERVVALAQYINSINADIAFHFASPEGARVAYGLGIPYFTANDSPHSRFVAQLTIPLAIALFTPWIMKKAWVESGIPQHKIISYHGLDPVAWLQDFTPNLQVLSDIGLDTDLEYVVIRPEESQAAYLYGRSNEISPVTTPVTRAITKEYPDLQVVLLCRYSAQRREMQKQFGNHLIIPDRVVDGPSLLSSAQLLVGAGGTMNQEASLLGTPVISCFPGDQLITDQYLAQKQLLYRVAEPKKAAQKALEILQHRREYKSEHHKRAQRLMREMENPTEIIYSQISAYYKEKMEKK